jgi:hypothetical protein
VGRGRQEEAPIRLAFSTPNTIYLTKPQVQRPSVQQIPLNHVDLKDLSAMVRPVRRHLYVPEMQYGFPVKMAPGE